MTTGKLSWDVLCKCFQDIKFVKRMNDRDLWACDAMSSDKWKKEKDFCSSAVRFFSRESIEKCLRVTNLNSRYKHVLLNFEIYRCQLSQSQKVIVMYLWNFRYENDTFAWYSNEWKTHDTKKYPNVVNILFHWIPSWIAALLICYTIVKKWNV